MKQHLKKPQKYSLIQLHYIFTYVRICTKHLQICFHYYGKTKPSCRLLSIKTAEHLSKGINQSAVHIYTSCNKCLSWSPETAFNTWAPVKIQTEEVINCSNNYREHAFQQILCSLSLHKLSAACMLLCYEFTAYLTSAVRGSTLV